MTTKETPSYQLLQFVEFASFFTWDVEKNTYLNEFVFGNAVSLASILTNHREPITHNKVKAEGLQIIKKIDFGGSLYLREVDELKNYKGNVYKVPVNSIIYSKINVRHGCIYFNTTAPFAVSNEYPCFTFDLNRISGKYLILLLRSQPFKNQMSSLKVGIGKARVKIDEFLSLQIPLPSLSEQERLVSIYEIKRNQANKLIEEILNFDNSLDEKLGIVTVEKDKIISGKLSFVGFDKIEQWGLDQIYKTITKYDTLFETRTVQQLCSIGSGGTPSRSILRYYKGDIPWIKTGEVVDDIIYDTEEKITNEAVANSSARIFPKGSLLMAMYGQGKTRGRTAKLGIDATTNQACAVLYDINNEIVLTDYLWIFLMNEYDRIRELASGNNQPNLNADMIKNYTVTIPPIYIQAKTVDLFFSIKEQIKGAKKEAKKLKKQALTEFENVVFKTEE